MSLLRCALGKLKKKRIILGFLFTEITSMSLFVPMKHEMDVLSKCRETKIPIYSTAAAK